MTKPYRTRFAPSPTGPMHLGHVRTSLVAWLRARAQGGEIVMRMEDLDPPRVVEGAADQILRDFEWLGLDWDEGPFYQSKRSSVYEEALEVLRTKAAVYPCTCSRKEIALASSAPHGDLGPVYPGTCRQGGVKAERAASQRFIMSDPSPDFSDVYQGQIESGSAPGDFIVQRADGLWAYQFAVVVDDAEMNISEVVRGADLLTSTPRQIALYHALGYEVPAFLHLPLVNDAQGKKLSSGEGALSLGALRDAGWSSSALLGAVAHSLGLVDRASALKAEDLIAEFQLKRLRVAPLRLEAVPAS